VPQDVAAQPTVAAAARLQLMQGQAITVVRPALGLSALGRRTPPHYIQVSLGTIRHLSEPYKPPPGPDPRPPRPPRRPPSAPPLILGSPPHQSSPADPSTLRHAEWHDGYLANYAKSLAFAAKWTLCLAPGFPRRILNWGQPTPICFCRLAGASTRLFRRQSTKLLASWIQVPPLITPLCRPLFLETTRVNDS
jgi:hypothetical protein